jgi:hypothetical protein
MLKTIILRSLRIYHHFFTGSPFHNFSGFLTAMSRFSTNQSAPMPLESVAGRDARSFFCGPIPESRCSARGAAAKETPKKCNGHSDNGRDRQSPTGILQKSREKDRKACEENNRLA